MDWLRWIFGVRRYRNGHVGSNMEHLKKVDSCVDALKESAKKDTEALENATLARRREVHANNNMRQMISVVIQRINQE